MISDEQVAFYREHGYLVVEGVLDSARLDELRRVTDRIIAGAGGTRAHTDVYDLEDSHTPSAPRVRRIKEPTKVHPVYYALARDGRILSVLSRLIGPDIRFHGDKLNIKAAAYGAPVEWHQDWAFYPHTNDDVLAVGILLDDAREENGPMMVVPGSHKGPIFDHHHDGRFAGAFDHEASRLDVSGAVPLLAPAGSITVHHARTVHGSTLNRSSRPRRLILFEFTAADAWPLLGMGSYGADDFEVFNRRIVAGAPCSRPRLVPVDVRLPLPMAHSDGSIYEMQKGVGRRAFARLEDAPA